MAREDFPEAVGPTTHTIRVCIGAMVSWTYASENTMKETKSNYCENCGEFHDPVHEYSAQVRVGEVVPDFEFEALYNEKIETLSISGLRGGWLILFFYTADFSVLCPTELSEMAALYEKFKKAGAEVVSVSTDTVFSHQAWRAADARVRNVPFAMGADPSGKMSYAFGVLVEGGEASFVPDEGLSQRGTFIIDPSGILRSIEISDVSIGRSGAETLRKLQAAQFVQTHKGLVCGASWQPGDEGVSSEK